MTEPRVHHAAADFRPMTTPEHAALIEAGMMALGWMTALDLDEMSREQRIPILVLARALKRSGADAAHLDHVLSALERDATDA